MRSCNYDHTKRHDEYRRPNTSNGLGKTRQFVNKHGGDSQRGEDAVIRMLILCEYSLRKATIIDYES